MRWLATLLALIGYPAIAAEDQWPGLFDVTDVAAGDTLNVRAGPGADAPIIGALPADAESIEVIRPNDSATWGLVNSGESAGWVSLRYMQRQEGQWLDAFPAVRRCYGTEPFWGLDIDSEGIAEFSEPDGGVRIGTMSWRLTSASRSDRAAAVIVGDTGETIAVLALGTCNDGMSDREFGIGIDLVQRPDDGDARMLSGCCSLSVSQ